MMKPPMNRARNAMSAMKTAVKRPTQIALNNPVAAPKTMAPSGNRPMGVSPPPLTNPMPMSGAEAASRVKTAAQRGAPMPQQAIRPAVETQPGFRSEPTPVAMAGGGKVRKPVKKATKAKRK
jgi:hypothetical protein